MSTLIGEVVMWAGTIDEDNEKRLEQLGFLPARGQLLDRKRYAELASVLGPKFARANDQFQLPDLQGRAPIGAGRGDGLSVRSVGEAPGREQIKLSAENLPPHSHSTPMERGQAMLHHQGYPLLHLTGRDSNMHVDVGTTETGRGVAHENLQPSYVLSFLIRFRV